MPSVIQVPLSAVIRLPTADAPLTDAPEFIAGTPNIFDVPNDQIVVVPASFVAREETSKYFPM